ncbi:MAG: hypothetical protein EBU36_03385 [Verrucomicrobia bacterium]|nr:hypothetical protein [Verrucomicrobiota bacterium]
MNPLIRLPALALFFGFAMPLPSIAQDSAADAAKKMLEAYNGGRYEEVVKLADDFIKANPQSPNLSSAQLLLARSQYSLGKWGDAMVNYRKVQASAKDKEIKEESFYYLTQAAAAEAESLPEKSADRKKKIEDAIQTAAAFTKEFPESKSMAETHLLRARLEVQLGKYTEASQDLEAARKADTDGSMREEIDYLQGFAEARRADEFMADFKKADAEAAMARAGQIYSRLASGNSPALAAEANLQMASLDLAAHRFAEAMARLRAIPGKQELIAQLESKLAPLRAELAQSSTPSPTKLSRIQREQRKIEEVKSRPDLSGQALLQLGQAYLQTRKYDEARLVFRQVAAYGGVDLSGPAEQQVILTYALQGRTSEADRLLAAYQKKYPDQKGIAGLVDYLVGRALLEDGETDKAIQRLKSAQEKASGERFADEIPRFIATAYQKAGQGQEALKYYEKFLEEVKSGKRKISDESAEQTRLLYAGTLVSEKKIAEGVKELTALNAESKTPSIREDAALRLGYALRAEQKFTEAAESFSKFAANYPQSPNLGNAMLARGDCLQEGKQTEAAIAAWKEAATKLNGTAAGLEAYERIWKAYAKDKKTDLMLAAQEDQFRAYPKDPRNIAAYIARGSVFAEARDESQAMQAYRRSFDLFRELYPNASTSPAPVAVSDSAYLAQEKISDLELTTANSLGTYNQLKEEDKTRWKDSLQKATDSLSLAILGYSSPRAPAALAKMVKLCLFRFQSGASPVEECLQPFRDLAGKAGENQGLTAQILFAQASVPYESGQAALALRLYEDAYKKSLENKVALDWRDLERFAKSLLDAGKNEEARPVFERIRKEFPASGPKDPKQYAQASALFGLGQIDFQANRKPDAEKLFAQLAKDYPWSEKLQEANYLRGLALAEVGKVDGDKNNPGAFELWTGVIESNRASNEIKAKTMLVFGQALEKKPGTKLLESEPGKPKHDPLDLAVEYYQKIDLYYDSLPEISGEGLLRAAKVRKGQQKNDEARKLVSSLLSKYPNCSSATEAAELLKSLPPASALSQ